MKVVFAQIAKDRQPPYRVITKIASEDGQNVVCKQAAAIEAVPFVNGLEHNYKVMAETYGKEHVAEGRLAADGLFCMEYVQGKGLDKILLDALSKKRYEEFIELFTFYYQHILPDVPKKEGNNDGYTLPLAKDRKVNIDLTFGNIIVGKSIEDLKIIDYEWLFPASSKDFLCCRAMRNLYWQGKAVLERAGMGLEQLLQGAGIDLDDMPELNARERGFYDVVGDFSSQKYEQPHKICY